MSLRSTCFADKFFSIKKQNNISQDYPPQVPDYQDFQMTGCQYVEIKCQLDATEVFIADLIACCNKNLCCIQLAFYFHILTTMHGQNHIRLDVRLKEFCYICIHTNDQAKFCVGLNLVLQSMNKQNYYTFFKHIFLVLSCYHMKWIH